MNRRKSERRSAVRIESYLASQDPDLGRLITAVVSRVGIVRPPRSKATPFGALVRAVVFQSVSGPAATTIYGKLVKKVGKSILPKSILAARVQKLRGVGLSAAKISTLRSLSTWFIENPDLARRLPTLDDKSITAHLVAIPGIGQWTVNVLLIFNLRRLDVVPTSDLGIRRGVQLLGGYPTVPPPGVVKTVSSKWAPYRSIASMYLWNAMKLKLGVNDLPAAYNDDAMARFR